MRIFVSTTSLSHKIEKSQFVTCKFLNKCTPTQSAMLVRTTLILTIGENVKYTYFLPFDDTM